MMKKVFVTGGLGFIGSHIVDKLIEQGCKVIVYDNFSTGNEKNLKQHSNEKNLRIIKGDIRDIEFLTSSMVGADFVFHLAANADVRGGIKNTKIDFEQNIVGTHNVLESMRLNKLKKIAFSSSATIYGEPDIFPTPETYSPIQTSLYGASKLSGEGLIQAYSNYYDIQNWIFRFVSWIGERYSHGVIYDFVKKVENNKTLEILGDGSQKKSYLYVIDGVEGIFLAINQFNNKTNIFNLGHTEVMDVTTLANIVCDELGKSDIPFKYVGGKRGWKGDSPFVHLDISKLTSNGWKPRYSIEEGIRKTVRFIKQKS